MAVSWRFHHDSVGYLREQQGRGRVAGSARPLPTPPPLLAPTPTATAAPHAYRHGGPPRLPPRRTSRLTWLCVASDAYSSRLKYGGEVNATSTLAGGSLVTCNGYIWRLQAVTGGYRRLHGGSLVTSAPWHSSWHSTPAGLANRVASSASPAWVRRDGSHPR